MNQKSVQSDAGVPHDEQIHPRTDGMDVQRELPSYWVGCVYRFLPGANKLDIIVQQTGVMPGILLLHKYSKLTATVTLLGKYKKKLTLVHSRHDQTFRSHNIQFPVRDRRAVREGGLKLCLYHHTSLFRKVCIADWHLDLSRCTTELKTEWRKYRNDRDGHQTNEAVNQTNKAADRQQTNNSAK